MIESAADVEAVRSSAWLLFDVHAIVKANAVARSNLRGFPPSVQKEKIT